MEELKQNVEIADDYEMKFIDNFDFEINDPPYKHVVDLKKQRCMIVGYDK